MVAKVSGKIKPGGHFGSNTWHRGINTVGVGASSRRLKTQSCDRNQITIGREKEEEGAGGTKPTTDGIPN